MLSQKVNNKNARIGQCCITKNAKNRSFLSCIVRTEHGDNCFTIANIDYYFYFKLLQQTELKSVS